MVLHTPSSGVIRAVGVISIYVISAALSSCAASQALAPRARPVADSTIARGLEAQSGCATVDLSINAAGRVVADTSHRAACGPAVPQLVGMPGFDQGKRLLTLTLAIRNTGMLNLHGPSEIAITGDSVRMNGHAVTALTVHATQYAPRDELKGGSLRVALSFDSVLRSVGPGGSTVLPRSLQAGHLSGPRELLITLPPGDSTLHLALRGRGQYVYTVAPTAPLSTPDSVFAVSHLPENVITNDSLYSGRLTRNRFYVRFKPDATVEERQAIVDAVDGVVIGGYHIGHLGYYYVDLPWAVGHNGRALDSAMRVVWTYKQIARLRPNALDVPSLQYQRPTDSSAYSSWLLNPSQATGDNWAPEAVSAPLAWGCSTGSSTTRIAVLDSGFRAIADLVPNLGPDTSLQSGGVVHGTWVSSIIAAAGNNGHGMSGMMWSAQLGLFFAFKPNGPDTALWPFDELATIGPKSYPIINISLSSLPADSTNIRSGHATKADSQKVWLAANDFQEAIEENNLAGETSLYVVAAGNQGLDAFWSGWPAAKYDSGTTTASVYARQIIVVGANENNSSPTGTIWPSSGTGALVDVVAPGYLVYALNGANQLQSVSGTSFATPMVSGLAGDLLAFNANLGVDSLKSFILRGATDGGRTAGGKPIINASASLRRAARMAGGPICGNRVFSNFDLTPSKLTVQRNDSAAGSTSDDAIVTGGIYGLVIPHLGHIIYDQVGHEQWAPATGWTAASGRAPYSPPGNNLNDKQNHDGDSAAFVHFPGVDSGKGYSFTATVWVRDSVGNFAHDSCHIATITHNTDSLITYNIGFASTTRNLAVLIKQITRGQADTSKNWYFKVPIPSTCPGTPATITASSVVFEDDSLGSARFAYSDGDDQLRVEKTNPYIINNDMSSPGNQQSEDFYNPNTTPNWTFQRQVLYSGGGDVQGVVGSSVGGWRRFMPSHFGSVAAKRATNDMWPFVPPKRLEPVKR